MYYSVRHQNNENGTVLMHATSLLLHQGHIAEAKHRLSAEYFAARHFWFFSFPTACISMANGIMSFLASTDLMSDRTGSLINVIVGSLALFIVFLQTLSATVDYDNRGKMHKHTAIDISEMLEEIKSFETRSLVEHVFNNHTFSSTNKAPEKTNEEKNDDDKIETTDEDKSDNNDNRNKTAENSKKADVENQAFNAMSIFDVIQKRYAQCLKANKSTVPLAIDHAFTNLDTRIQAMFSKEEIHCSDDDYKNRLVRVYIHSCDELRCIFSEYRGFPLFLPRNSKRLIVRALKETPVQVKPPEKRSFLRKKQNDDG